MDTKQYPTGVRPHGAGIKIRFSWNGARHEPTWPRKPTASNIAAASRLRTDIVSKAKFGTLTWIELAEHFPQYVDPSHVISEVPLFGEIAQTYLNTVEVSPNTRTEYRYSLMRYWQPLYAATPINQISAADLRKDVSDIEWTSAKTRNNNLIPLRGVFQLAVEDDLIDRNPADRLKNLKYQRPEIDPFTQQEADLIVAHLYKIDINCAAYFELAFWSGLRTSELLALNWDDIDFNSGYIKVSKALSKGRLNTQTKTAKMRHVMLNERSLHALKAAKALTFLRGGPIFVSMQIDEPWVTAKAPRQMFDAAMKKLGIRRRRAYNTRHTYATICLMAGMNPAFVASQLGHSVTMLLNSYAKWIHGEANHAEMAKLGQKWDRKNGAESK